MHTFVDDYGDTGVAFDTPNVSSHFIVAAVSVQSNNTQEVLSPLDIATQLRETSDKPRGLRG